VPGLQRRTWHHGSRRTGDCLGIGLDRISASRAAFQVARVARERGLRRRQWRNWWLNTRRGDNSASSRAPRQRLPAEPGLDQASLSREGRDAGQVSRLLGR